MQCFKRKDMFGLFKGKSEEEKLRQKFDLLMKEAFELSHIDRKNADLKYAEADEIGRKLEQIKAKR